MVILVEAGLSPIVQELKQTTTKFEVNTAPLYGYALRHTFWTDNEQAIPMYDYEEACPISKAASVLCERWTLQILREMFFGASRFSEFQRYLPRISPSLLKTRLQTLEQQDLVVRRKIPEKKSYEYRLTPAGQALKPMLTEMGKWGMQHSFGRVVSDEVNPATMVRDFSVALKRDQLPTGGSTMAFIFTDEQPVLKMYLMLREGVAQVCDENFGTEVDLYLTSDKATFARIWYGRQSIASARNKGDLKVIGNTELERSISKWLGISQMAQRDE